MGSHDMHHFTIKKKRQHRPIHSKVLRYIKTNNQIKKLLLFWNPVKKMTLCIKFIFEKHVKLCCFNG